MGQWVSSYQIIKNRVNSSNKIIEFCLKIYDLWRHTHLWVGAWVIVWISGWGHQITRNSIIQKLIKIIQFCLKVFVFFFTPTQFQPLDYTQISNNSIGLESIKIIQFYLKISIPSRLLHSWVGEWFDGWVEGWSYVNH